MNTQALQATTLPNGSTKLETEHKALVEIIKAVVTNLYQLGPMSFVLNSTLLGAISFAVFQSNRIHPDLIKNGVYFASALGVLYNLGAFSSCIASTILVTNLFSRIRAVDGLLGFEISACRRPISIRFNIITFFCSILFFVLWTILWVYLACFNYSHGVTIPVVNF